MAKRNASLSATLSAVYATFLLLGWAALAPRIAWSQLGAVTKFWTIGASVGTVLAVALGWIYRGMGWRAAGVIHALLMSIIGLVGFFHGAAILSDKSIAGGQGPDANPVAGIIYLAAFCLSACFSTLQRLVATTRFGHYQMETAETTG
ncbi:membrane hypothetical protein [Verrucomicrobia bacterium]|nr:membrane hypothetical protein [Verrucomicrobiota bacterium]